MKQTIRKTIVTLFALFALFIVLPQEANALSAAPAVTSDALTKQVSSPTPQQLGTPSLTGAKAVSDGIKVSWKEVSGASKYRVFRKSGTSWVKVADTASLRYTDTNVTPNASYTYTVRCLSSDGKSYVSAYDWKGVSTTYWLGTPSLTGAEAVSDGIKVSWKEVSGASKYRIFRKSGTGWVKVADTASLSYTDTNVTLNTSYTYTIRCLSSDGKSYISDYDWRGVSTTYCMGTPKLTSATASSDGITVSWGSVNGAAKYRIFRRSDTSWVKVADTTFLSYTDTDVTPNTSYTYTVRCLSPDGKSYASAYDWKGISATYWLGTPSLTSAETVSDGIKVSWKEVSGASKYRVFQKSGTSWVKVADTTSLSYTDTAVTPNTPYTYTVRCLSSDSKEYVSNYDWRGISATYLAKYIVTCNPHYTNFANVLGTYSSMDQAKSAIQAQDANTRDQWFVIDRDTSGIVWPELSTDQQKLDKALAWTQAIANDSRHGYTCDGELTTSDLDLKWGRWGIEGDYSCSTLVSTAYEIVGFANTRTVAQQNSLTIPIGNGTQAVGLSSVNLGKILTKSGKFTNVTEEYNQKGKAALQPGDVLIQSTSHVALYVGNNKIAEATNNELKQEYGKGKPGDQTGHEIAVNSWRSVWTEVYRPIIK